MMERIQVYNAAFALPPFGFMANDGQIYGFEPVFGKDVPDVGPLNLRIAPW